MKKIHLIFFDAGGGHRSAANALSQVIQLQDRPWCVEKVNLQELFDSLDIFRQLTGVRMQDLYNSTLRRGWTLGSPQLTRAMHGIIRMFHSKQVRVLQKFWAGNPADLVVSLIPNFNRALFDGLRHAHPGTPYLTVLTDFADFPPHFWIEKQDQYFVCGTERAVEQCQQSGHSLDRIFRSSGMILHPKFYQPQLADRGAGRSELGLHPDLPTGIVLFGGFGSNDIETVVESVAALEGRLQLILICGHNRQLAERLRALDSPVSLRIEGFTPQIPYLMHLSDFFIGKPGPASISEALRMQLPVLVERNAWTLPQERYNAQWVQEKDVGVILKSFREVAPAIEGILNHARYAQLKERIRGQQNRAVFEIPGFMERILKASGSCQPKSITPTASGA